MGYGGSKSCAGEIILTSITNEGLGKGFDLDLIKELKDNIKVPLIIHGGAGQKKMLRNSYLVSKVSGIAVASAFHYHYLKFLKKTIYLQVTKIFL